MLFDIQYFVCNLHYQREWQVVVPKRPFWRLWWNDCEAASVITSNDEVALTPEHFVLVAPHTDFSVSLRNPTEHLDVHFELAEPFESAAPGLYTVSATPGLIENLKEACSLSEENRRRQLLLLTRVVSDVFLQLPGDVWQDSISDERIARVLRAMSTQLGESLSNRHLAKMAHMAPTAFIRRFKQVLGRSPQSYYLQKRLDQACIMLETGNQSIDLLAEECGFCDRNYFSTVFHKHFGISPAAFRRASRHL